jgi:hypothetical protein
MMVDDILIWICPFSCICDFATRRRRGNRWSRRAN